jgi:peptidoglycan hydrolase-like protein with peptidoglycan-binding domain
VNRRSFLTGGALATVGLLGTGSLFAVTHGSSAGASNGSSPTTTLPPSTKTTKVSKRDLVQTEQVDGKVGYGEKHTIGGGPGGVITALPAEGTVIDRGDTLWEVDGGPGPALLFGDKPMWRNLSSGVDKGEDVRQLEENLVALGYADPAVMTVDDKYTSATATAVKKWQKARGVEQTGTVDTTDVVFSSGPIRVADRKVAVGDKAAAATILEVTGAEQIVTVKLDPSKAAVARQDDPVTIKLSDGRTIDGTVRSVGTVVHSESNGNGGTSNYLDVVVALAAGQSAGLDDAPVTVNFTRSSATGVLAVPVRALLALAEGGYAVERVTGTGTEFVPVKLGAFADGYVEITGSVAEGDTVVVA